jgi:uncharacterized membrane protein YfhO
LRICGVHDRHMISITDNLKFNPYPVFFLLSFPRGLILLLLSVDSLSIHFDFLSVVFSSFSSG